MAKAVQKKEHVGFRLDIKRTSESKWERVGFLFKTQDEAIAYRHRHYSTSKVARVTGVRIDISPLGYSDASKGDGTSLTRQEKQAQYLAEQKKRTA